MAQWKAKQFGDLTGVSVRMLHHYDEIGLLEPSARASNGYRLYSKQDLEKLQQIVTLKFFGFSLHQIKTMLEQKRSIKEQLLAQQQILEEQTEHLQQTQNALSTAIQTCSRPKSLDWKSLVALVQRSKMVQEIKKTWANKLTQDQKNFYIELRRKFPQELKKWEEAVEYINSEFHESPEDKKGKQVVEAFFKFQKVVANHNKYSHIFKTTAKKVLTERGIAWFTKAMKVHKKMNTNSLLNHKDKS